MNANERIFKRQNLARLFVPFAFLLFTFSSLAQTPAPGAPGKNAHWASAGKQAVGTSASLESKVWFTLAQGAMTEVYYPDVTTANVHLLQFVVVNPKTKKVETEQDALIKNLSVNGKSSRKSAWLARFMQERWTEFDFSKSNQDVNSLYFNQITSLESGKWLILKSYITDPQSNTVMMRVRFGSFDKDLQLYVYYDPSLANTGMGDTAWNQEDALLSRDKNISSALISTAKLTEISNGFYGMSDGLEQLKANGRIITPYAKAENGNVAQIAKVDTGTEKRKAIDFALSFGKTPDEALQTAKSSLAKGFDKTLAQYTRGWSDYVKTLPVVEPKYQAQFNMAAMVLKAQEDKTVRGANVASLTVPWGGGVNANEDVGGGYHLVWSRDLYQVVTAYMALGDMAAANRALDFLFNVQQKPDGSFPQNSWLDGKGGWGSLQLDEVAYPLIIAYQLKRFDKATYENHVKKAADFLVKTGPKTPQERWEEKSGYSPSTIAAEIAGLVCAAEIAKRNGDEASATVYLATADDWVRNVERWTATTNGKYGDGNYYIRLTENGTPDAREKTILNNGAGTFIENEIVDAGFLELVRLGIKSPDDPLIVKSLKVIDEQIKVNTPNGEGFYRYNHDGYGEMDDGRRWNWDGKYTGKGRLWALLSGERGQYELAQYALSEENFTNSLYQRSYQSKKLEKNKEGWTLKAKAKSRLDAMLNFANDGLMIPEQVWDKADVPKNIDKQYVPELKFGEGTGSATPLAWSMAQFIRLTVNLQAGRNLDTPDVVYNRYVLGKKETSNTKRYQTPEKCNVHLPELYSDDGKFIKYGRGSNSSIFFLCQGETNEIYVFYEGKANKVEIVGDFTGWKSGGYDFGEIVKDQWIIRLSFPPTARVEYKFIVDGKWIIDPLNPNKIDNGVGGENSFFTMPDYQPTVWDKENKFSTAKIEEVEIDSKVYGKRTVKIYQPLVNSNEKTFLPTLYLQDGSDYINRAKAIQIQENLVKAGKVKPFIMVFVDYKERTKEYWASDDYAKFLATEVVPAIDGKYNTIKSRDGRAILGASLGGITSIHTALKYPEVFSRIGGQSSSFWIDNERVVKELEKLDGKSKFKFYFDDGTLEGVEDTRRVNVMLRGKGYDVTYVEGETGHNWTSWRDRLADAVISLWK
ncbi:MAG: glycoside hydrolase family 15 protein [Pyrinomonadaceae bacterium]